MVWAHPWSFILLLGLPIWWWWRARPAHNTHNITLSSTQVLPEAHQTLWTHLIRLSVPAQSLIFVLLVFALARPQQRLASWPKWDKGIDIMLVLDTSSSMLHKDLYPSRLKVAKALLHDIIQYRRQRNDRMGLVLFAKEAFTLCPLTSDLVMLKEMLSKVTTGVIRDDMALGDAMTTGIARMEGIQKDRKKALLLLTDGENNAGQVHPLLAAQLARARHIRIFPILMGKPGRNRRAQKSTLVTPWQILQKVARLSGGSAHKAQNKKSFQRALHSILNTIAPSRRKTAQYRHIKVERFQWFLLPALCLLALMFLLRLTRLRTIA